MIVRMWRGKVRKDLKSEYVAYLNQTGLADYGKVEGNQGVYLLCQDLGDNVEFLTMTFWTSIAAIKKFAGSIFASAGEMFGVNEYIIEDLRNDYGEKRFVSLGFINRRLCVVVWTPRGDGRHIISMRKANDREQKNYKVWVGSR